MFSGIVAAQGNISQVEEVQGDRRFTVQTDGDYLDVIARGDSVAVNGACLTVVDCIKQGFTADVSVETLSLTTARHWQVGQRVNLERATTPATALGGHIVLGHVDGIAQLVEAQPEARSHRLVFEVPQTLARYIARKASVTLDGVSLTVNEVDGRRFGVNIIPVTYTQTTLGTLQRSAGVNLEVDVLARYIERLLEAGEN